MGHLRPTISDFIFESQKNIQLVPIFLGMEGRISRKLS